LMSCLAEQQNIATGACRCIRSRKLHSINDVLIF
jgi:hypothetical protein